MLTIAFSILLGTLAVGALIELITNRDSPLVTYLLGLFLYILHLIVALTLLLFISLIYVAVLLILKTPKMASEEFPNLGKSFHSVLKKFVDLAKKVPRYTSEIRPASYGRRGE